MATLIRTEAILQCKSEKDAPVHEHGIKKNDDSIVAR